MPCSWGQLAGPKAGMTECDRGSAEQGPGESRHNNVDGRSQNLDLITVIPHLLIENYTMDINGSLPIVLSLEQRFQARPSCSSAGFNKEASLLGINVKEPQQQD